MTIRRGVTFSDDGKYRYRLWVRWDDDVSVLMSLCLNPSKADEFKDDATVTRIIRRAKTMGFGGVEICNIFALMSTEPEQLYLDSVDPIGPENNQEMFAAAQVSSMILCGWGTHGDKVQAGYTGHKVLEFLKHPNTVALGVNADGSPKHPLYVSYKTEPVQYGQVHAARG